MTIGFYSLNQASNPEAPHVLFCHAAGFTGLVWREISRGMRSKGARYSIDFRGHGKSPTLPLSATWRVFADDVTEAAVRIRSERLIGVGHSLGGTALLVASAARADMFAALVCFEPIVRHEEDRGFADKAAQRRARFPSRDDAFRRFAGKAPLSLLAPPVLRDYVASGLKDDPLGGVQLACHPETEAQIYRTAPEFGTLADLSSISCPVLLIAGSRSAVAPRLRMEQLAERIPHAAVRELPYVGHLGPLERPALFARLLDDLVLTVDRSNGDSE